MTEKIPKRKCPIHKAKLVSSKTRYGTRWSCPESGCTVVCWGSPTSTPADLETRQARHRAHEVFDSLWKGDFSIMPKALAFKQLSEFMKLPQKDTHIGFFNIEQCQQVLLFCRQCRESKVENANNGSRKN